MNSNGKFLVSALLVHAANLKKIGDTQNSFAVSRIGVPVNNYSAPAVTANK